MLGKTLKKKTTSVRGESVAEAMVSLLIIFLAVTTLSGLILFSYRTIVHSKETLGSYYEAENLLSTQNGEPAAEGTVTISAADGSTVALSAGRQLKVSLYAGAGEGRDALVSYRLTGGRTGGGS